MSDLEENRAGLAFFAHDTDDKRPQTESERHIAHTHSCGAQMKSTSATKERWKMDGRDTTVKTVRAH